MDLVVIGFLAFLGVLFVLHFWLEESRSRSLRRAYGDNEISKAIIEKKIFQGMSNWQLQESWGAPDAVETTVLKTKTKETWLYGRVGRGFLNRVYPEDGHVVGWRQRGR